jgi:2-keto-3-deoxy-L-rhamnonate aldolase RhmA
MRDVVAKAEAKILARSTVALGGLAASADDARAMIARGYRFVVLGSDAGLITGAARHMVHSIKEKR